MKVNDVTIKVIIIIVHVIKANNEELQLAIGCIDWSIASIGCKIQICRSLRAQNNKERWKNTLKWVIELQDFEKGLDTYFDWTNKIF